MMVTRSLLMRPLALALATSIICYGQVALASSWNKTRESAMSLKERGAYQQAYSLTSSHKSSKSHDAFDQEWSSGWIALKSLQRPDVAIRHFTNAATQITRLREDQQDPARAKVSYWLAQALKSKGQASAANKMLSIAAQYANTFYGQIAASETNTKPTRAKLLGYLPHYQTIDLVWHDQRANREFVHAIIREESRFRQTSTSGKGAIGSMQVMAGTAADIGKSVGVKVDINLLRTSADYNIAIGSKYLGDMLTSFKGNHLLAAAAYNSGPGRVDEWLKRFGDPRGGRVDPIEWAESIPFKETRDYVQKVISSYVMYIHLAPLRSGAQTG